MPALYRPGSPAAKERLARDAIPPGPVDEYPMAAGLRREPERRTPRRPRAPLAEARVKPNENVTEREWFYQMIMLPREGLLLSLDWGCEQGPVDILGLAVFGTGHAMKPGQQVVDLAA
jgi:hypothetical protein